MEENFLFKKHWHTEDLAQYNFLVTGGAGFIGSNIIEYLLKYNAGHVRVLDNLSNGYILNIESFKQYSNFEFINGDIRNIDTCRAAVADMHFISHQAALGSVPRSITDPITSNEVNISGFLNILHAAKESTALKRLVYAASSSTYGDSVELPKVEGKEGKPLSPYAVTKLVNELYADVFSKVYGFHTIGLRYFNIFGPKQNPLNPYAAVIPLFMQAALKRNRPIINGDGETSRDFTFVGNAVQANIRAMLNTKELSNHEVCNIATNGRTTLNELWQIISELANCTDIEPEYRPERAGDVRASLADISKAKRILGYIPEFNSFDGLRITYKWFVEQYLDNI